MNYFKINKHLVIILLFSFFLCGIQACKENKESGKVRVVEEAEALPNIILVMADDLGWGDVAYNGNPIVKTPHLDAMSKSGVKLNRFYAAAPVCSPTRASCLTLNICGNESYPTPTGWPASAVKEAAGYFAHW